MIFGRFRVQLDEKNPEARTTIAEITFNTSGNGHFPSGPSEYMSPSGDAVFDVRDHLSTDVLAALQTYLHMNEST